MSDEVFPIALWHPVEIASEGFKNARTAGYGGTMEVDNLVSISYRTFAFPCRMLSRAELQLAWDFFHARLGGYDNFFLNVRLETGVWQNVRVFFHEDTFRYSWSSALWHDIGTLKFIEDK